MITVSLILIIGGPAFFLGWLLGTLLTLKMERPKLEKATNEARLLQAKAAKLQTDLLHLNRAVSMAKDCLEKRS